MWDRRTHALLNDPVEVAPAQDGQQPDDDSAAALLAIRPAHPGEVAVNAPGGGIDLWSAVDRRRIRTIGATAERHDQTSYYVDDREPVAVFDAEGRTLAVLGTDAVEVWDADTGTRVAHLDVPGVRSVVGFTADGYLVVVSESSATGESTVHLLDVASRAETGSFTVEADVSPFDLLVDGRVLRSASRGVTPLVLRATASDWYDTLCQVIDEDFDDREQGLLPKGLTPRKPCG